jgi:D-sedoheptulose 7-phosphate isomerase
VSDERPSGGVESLYPFLYPGAADRENVLAEVRRSTAAKAREILELRARILDEQGDRLAGCAEAMAERLASGGKILAFGNGGSSTDAMDVVTTFLAPGPGARALPAIALTADIAVVTALANDIGFEVVFARQVAALGRERDVAIGLSTSGNSENVIRAFEEAARRGLLTVGLAGYDGGRMAEADTIDYLFVVPSSSVHRIQEAQTTIYHVLWELTQEALGASRRAPAHVATG